MPPIYPSREDVAAARVAFGEHEPRDIFYRAATELIRLARTGACSVTVGEAICVLLQTWNRAFYQYHPASARHIEDIEHLLARHAAWLQRVQEATISECDEVTLDALDTVFTDFEGILGPVGAAKALHLLAPHCLPLWDRKIAWSYGVELGSAGSNASRYRSFFDMARSQSERLGGDAGLGRPVLKALDEYNYCHFTKHWI